MRVEYKRIQSIQDFHFKTSHLQLFLKFLKINLAKKTRQFRFIGRHTLHEYVTLWFQPLMRSDCSFEKLFISKLLTLYFLKSDFSKLFQSSVKIFCQYSGTSLTRTSKGQKMESEKIRLTEK